ncbi:MAG: sugar transferase [Pirellulales bacterium]
MSNWLDRPSHRIHRAGWLGSDRLGLLLPATDGKTATALAQALSAACDARSRAVDWRVDTYPNARRLSRPARAATGAAKKTLRPCPAWKRAMDIAGGVVGLVVLLPLFVAVAAWIKCFSRGPVIFRQQRYGLGGRPFTLWKFRTLETIEAPERHCNHVADLMASDRPLEKSNHTLAIIRGGGVLRKLGLDELPQLVNVLRGEMSLVGPRPDVVPFDSYAAWQRGRFDVKPGITGLWQVSGKNRTTFSTMMRMDIEYVRRRSLWLDLVILLRTVPAVALN